MASILVAHQVLLGPRRRRCQVNSQYCMLITSVCVFVCKDVDDIYTNLNIIKCTYDNNHWTLTNLSILLLLLFFFFSSLAAVVLLSCLYKWVWFVSIDLNDELTCTGCPCRSVVWGPLNVGSSIIVHMSQSIHRSSYLIVVVVTVVVFVVVVLLVYSITGVKNTAQMSRQSNIVSPTQRRGQRKNQTLWGRYIKQQQIN